MTMPAPNVRRPARPARRRAGAAAGLLLALPLVGACGFDAQTNIVNTVSSGVNDRTGNIDVLGAVVVASGTGTGVFEASFANNTPEDSPSAATAGDTFLSITGADGTTLTPTGTVKPIPIPAGGFFSMIKKHRGIPVSGNFVVGDFVGVTLQFQSGQVTTMTIPVVRPCFEYGGIVTPSTSPTLGSATPLPSSPTSAASDYTSPTAVGTDTAAPGGSNDDPLSCTDGVQASELPTTPGQPFTPIS